MAASDHLNPAQFWHVSHPVNRDSIRSEGLKAENGVWGWTHKSKALADAGPKGDVWEVRGHPDVEHGSRGSIEWNEQDPVAVTYSHVHPSNIRLVRTGGW